ncbi:DUF192 domain-containing protein [Leptolyngbya sp. AN02str]|uniref:DUF192 domain-containing protein n=1 Tax=Leptolyngbya sp. AN02str TaxID=3423363 RepID=UPI003D316155
MKREKQTRQVVSGVVCLLSVGLSVLLMGCTNAPADSPSSSPAPNPSTAAEAQTMAQSLPITAEATMADQVIQLEVARSPQEQAMGLMYRPSLEDNRGMLFPFRRARPVQFWMRNVLIPLDMVFLRNGEVQAIVTAPPCDADPCPTYGPRVPVDSVIELRGGRAAEIGLSEGDRVELRFLEP